MRILYLSLSHVPSRSASSVHVMKMCAALARRGHDVVLVAKRGADVGDDHAYYCVDRTFTLEKLARPVRRGGGVLYTALMAASILRRRRWADLIYSRDQLGTMIAARTGIPFVWEAHGVPETPWRCKAIASALVRPQSRGVVSISDALARDLFATNVVTARSRLVIAPDACDLPPSIARRPNPRPIVGYVGGLHPGRGIELIMKLAGELPGVGFRIVGGDLNDLARLQSSKPPGNVELLGYQPQARLPELYAGLDVVVMPYDSSGVQGVSRRADTSRWMSPMKMFEYMASNVPIVASDLPVLREVLRDGENALLARVKDVGSWRGAIERLIAEPALRERLARAAYAEVATRYTWDARAQLVMTKLGLESA